MSLRRVIREILPPFVTSWYRRWNSSYSFSGDYPSWDQAVAAADGYDSPAILMRVRDAVRAVLDGKAAFERDGMTFGTMEHDWAFLSGLMTAAADSTGQFIVVDIGGSLGSTYLRYRSFLGKRSVRWTIAEQPNYVSEGRALFQRGEIRFTDDVKKALGQRKVDLVILSSVLPYVSDPYGLLKSVAASGPRYVLLDRTPVVPGRDRLTVQKTRPPLVRASYPAWFLNLEKIRSLLLGRYDIVTEYPALDSTSASGIPGARDIGLLCRIRRPGRR